MDAQTPLDLNDRIRAKMDERGRKLTAQELIEVINSEPDEPNELTYEEDS